MTIAIEFVGAARTVTGSRHLIRTARSRILLDCGLFQGRRKESRQRNQELGVDAAAIDAVVLSHAHIDHSGALPSLCKHGYDGPIYATPATRDLCAVMLQDAAMIQAADARYLNRAIEREHVDADPIEPLYSEADADRALELMVGLPYHQRHAIAEDAWLTFLDAGHVLGSAVVLLEIDDEGERKRIVFSGDLGRSRLPILRDPQVPAGATTLILESTYGDRLHPPIAGSDDELADVLVRTHRRGGKVVIPSFALERAQEVILALKRLRRSGRVPEVPVYVDSPLTVDITQVFQLHPECFDHDVRAMLLGGDSPFSFPGLRYVHDVAESKAIDANPAPCVIISASGMCEAGRVLHHLKATVEDPSNAVVIVGFQAQHTLGRRIVERRKRVRIFGVERSLAAEVAVLDGFSAHADRDELVAFASEVRERGKLREVFLVHGEPPAQEALRKLLFERGFPTVGIPGPGEIARV